VKITAIRLDRMRLPLDPPFCAALLFPQTHPGQVTGQPASVLFGGATGRLPAYASFGAARDPQDHAQVAQAAKSAGFWPRKYELTERTSVPALRPCVPPGPPADRG
jgi:hypothetical protein